jgi:hypothetical protein
MGADEKKADFPPLESLAQQITDREEIAQRLAHLLAIHQQVSRMDPMLHERPSGLLQSRALTLGDLVFVMRECQILATQMDIEARSEKSHAHGRTLDVPSRATFAPRAVPEDGPIPGDPGLP